MAATADWLDDIFTALADEWLLDRWELERSDVACRHTVDDAEARVRLRVRIADELLRHGWTAPAAVTEQLESDRVLAGWPVRLDA